MALLRSRLPPRFNARLNKLSIPAFRFFPRFSQIYTPIANKIMILSICSFREGLPSVCISKSKVRYLRTKGKFRKNRRSSPLSSLLEYHHHPAGSLQESMFDKVRKLCAARRVSFRLSRLDRTVTNISS